ncbi:P-loop containing nucleoside triphosphate hydrolase protein [Backusella circina FSU 941]|nr:P-loop containing nucleoside triphosphate hydrolase protein [Backusella circina FSU 941]
MGQAISSKNISFFRKRNTTGSSNDDSSSLYEDISDTFTKAKVSSLAIPMVIVAYPVLNAYMFHESDITGHRIVDGAIGGLLGVIAWPLSPFFAVWGLLEFAFQQKPPTPLPIDPEVLKQAKESIQLDTRLHYNVAVIGCAGSGKSSLVNAIMGIRDNDQKAAEVGEVETTSIPLAYQHPDLVSMHIWDMPGVGTTSHPPETYFENNFLCAFDLFVLVLGDRVMKHDIDIAEKAKEFKIPVLFVRSKADVALKSRKERHQGASDTFEWATEVGKLVGDIQNSLYKELKSRNMNTRKLFVLSAKSLRRFVATINKTEQNKMLKLIDEERFMTALTQGILGKRETLKKNEKKDRKEKKKQEKLRKKQEPDEHIVLF